MSYVCFCVLYVRHVPGSISPAHPLVEDSAESQQTAKDDLLRLAASAEQSSDHPLSRAVLDAARRRGLALHALKEDATVLYVGSGVQCDTGFGVVLVGNRALMEEQQVFLFTCTQKLCFLSNVYCVR